MRIALRAFGIATVAVLLAGCADTSAEKTIAVAPGQIALEEMAGLNFTGLTDPQKSVVLTVMNTEGCTCGCGMTLAKCRRDDPSCRTSIGLGSQVIALAKQGKTQPQIVAALNRPGQTPTAGAQANQQVPKYIEFQLPTGENNPQHGPDDAAVTILHYLDFQ